jgi:glycosyltransferase involved in cell wall biosynthesis
VTVGLYSPLPPARTGVADYSAALLAELRKHGRVEIAPEGCDVALYHLGNNELHSAIYRRALERPGVIVLHDAVLHHFLLGQLDQSAYTEEFVYNYGEWNRGLAGELWRGRASSAGDGRYFEFAMLRRVAERALAVVVHNPAAARMVHDHAPQARIVEIPFLFVAPVLPCGADTLRYRQHLGVEPDDFLFGVFGYLRESKRLMTVLEAFREVHRETGRARLLVAGQFVSSDLERAVEPLLAECGVLRLPHLPEAEFWQAAAAVDACISLRYPAAGETSAITIPFMGIGKPVLVTDSLECSRFPEDACIRIPPGLEERASLKQHMILLTSMDKVASAIAQRGAGYIRAHHPAAVVGQMYWGILCDSCT